MNVEFVMGRKPNGTYHRMTFEARIEHEPHPFEFDIRPKRLGHNIAEILHQYAEVDSIRRVDLIGQTTMPIGEVTAYLDAHILLFEHNEIVNWTARTKRPTPHLGKRLVHRMEPYLFALKPIIAGTARSVLPELKEQARQVIRDQAEKTARSMMAYAEALLTYLDKPF